MTTAKDALSNVKGATVTLTKKKLSPDAALASQAINERLQAKLEDRLSTAAKSATSATTAVQEISLPSLTANLGAAGVVQALKSSSAKAINAASTALTRGKDALLGNVLKSKVSGMMSSQTAAMIEGESKINAKLAPTVVTTGPQDDLLTVDAYDFQAKDILSGFTGKLSSSVLGDIGDSFRAGGGLAANMANLLKRGSDGKIGLNGDAFKDRLVNSLGGRTGLLNSMSGALKNSIGQATGIPDNILNRADVVINGVVRSVQTGDIKSASTLFGLVGGVLDDSSLVEFLDVGAKTSLLTELYRQAMTLGVPEAIDIIVDKAGDNDKAAVYALSMIIDDAVINGNIQTVNKLIDKLGPAAVLAKFPSAVPQILASYQYATVTAAGPNFPVLYAELNTTLSRLDPNWGRRTRNGVSVLDLSVFTNISVDARAILSSTGPFVEAVQVASLYPPVALAQRGKQMYPLAAL